MFGKRLHLFMGRGNGRRSGLRTAERLKGSNVQSCVCPKCGYRAVHERGVPCRSVTCPQCNTPLVGDTESALVSKEGSFKETKTINDVEVLEPVHKRENKKTGLATVDKDLCVGCGTCLSICPCDAIAMQEGVAVIDADKCKGCGKCVKVCPVDAISF